PQAPVHHSSEWPANKGQAPAATHSKQFPAPLGAPPILHHSENWEAHRGEAPTRPLGQHPPFVHKTSPKDCPPTLGTYLLLGAIMLLWITIPATAALAFFGN
ncbi:MAG: hypothetical protein AB7K09_22955, partial [Planctomycetota bacterium]